MSAEKKVINSSEKDSDNLGIHRKQFREKDPRHLGIHFNMSEIQCHTDILTMDFGLLLLLSTHYQLRISRDVTKVLGIRFECQFVAFIFEQTMRNQMLYTLSLWIALAIFILQNSICTVFS